MPNLLRLNTWSAMLYDIILDMPSAKCPEEFDYHKMITIAHVYDNHYVMVELEREYPMPSILAYWVRHRASSAVGWQTIYENRLKLYKQLNPCNRDKAFIHIEDD
ncbi:hypothetical protein E3N88_11829 [Mikania micrantha]|uniref:Uncharacterized protein n=1 Tax=Mikania micrantha TaxID=192012 RepID=A0A5N6P3T3_9ASTR|nr:hypothetical protein E3N88_11829 [Mikania micrantha]